jgi:phosphoribosylamine--glycine ligase
VLGVVTTASDLSAAVDRAYQQVEKVHFANAYYRRDIGQRALHAGVK